MRHIIPFTYKPKISAVKAGTCRQTIRIIKKSPPKKVGDDLLLHTWAKKPYYSSWDWRKDEKCVQLYDVLIYVGGISCKTLIDDVKTICEFKVMYFYPWETLDWIAERDGIEPPTGKAMGELFRKMHKLPNDGASAQIIRW